MKIDSKLRRTLIALGSILLLLLIMNNMPKMKHYIYTVEITYTNGDVEVFKSESIKAIDETDCVYLRGEGRLCGVRSYRIIEKVNVNESH